MIDGFNIQSPVQFVGLLRCYHLVTLFVLPKASNIECNLGGLYKKSGAIFHIGTQIV